MTSVNIEKKITFGFLIVVLGIVFGDIGTSPLYAFKEAFSPTIGFALNRENVFGVLSLIFWAQIIVVCFKYLFFILNANNDGEGGTIALLSIISNKLPHSKSKYILSLLGIFATALFFGDGAITPAISVLSAVEGLNVIDPNLNSFVIPISCVILIFLFIIQKHGTQKVGKFFGPAMCCWFFILALLGVNQIIKMPEILYALNPYYGFNFFVEHKFFGILILSAILLTLTGVEALYSDMGHFGKNSIIIVWFLIVFPSLMLNYLGQGALVLQNPEKISNPFYGLAPDWFLIPLLIISTLATIIASQAVISGVYSITKQAIALGYLPRFFIDQTSEKEIGQIYIPSVNNFLLVIVLALVLLFKNSGNLAAAYGLAVTGTLFIDTILAASVFYLAFKWKKIYAIVFCCFFLVFDFLFLSANAHKIIDGGWLPIVIGVFLFTIMTTWKTGREILKEKAQKSALDLKQFINTLALDMPHRIDGQAVFMHAHKTGIPPALLHNLKHNQVLHQTILILTVETLKKPYSHSSEKLEIESLGNGFFKGTAHFGYMEDPDIPRLLKKRSTRFGINFEPFNASYFLNRETIVSIDNPEASKMARWREYLFIATAKNAADAASHFNIPSGQVIELGCRIEI